ncbi:anacyclamide/piricyclamide family prenylated cyclic peptide [Lyngbya sp. CCAP 1446/10]|nr:anacyclamide/piricyclamide family prenylated cyclic peptide [Lyngbya sp. CCAP 1446/10]
MKKKSLRPIQTAPVQRDTTATSASSSHGLAASYQPNLQIFFVQPPPVVY